jgi:hypothetical protein
VHLLAVDSDVALHFTAKERWAFECGARAREFVFPRAAEALQPSAA